MDFKTLYSVVADDFDAVNRFITARLDTNVPMIREVGEYIVGSGGKRLRPLVAVLAARACGYRGQHHVHVAAIIEFLHTATLLHDDVVDESDMRRGRPTVNAVWGNAASVLVGDFLISRAFQLVVEVGDLTLMDILADSTNIISEGEVLQLINCRDPATTEERYMRVIHHKTAKMFESAAETGAVLGLGAEQPTLRRSLAAYGRHLGIAFQLVDDVLDYVGDADELGKNVGDDLAEGKPTLPLIHAMRVGTPAQASLIRDAILKGGLDHLDDILAIVRDSGGLEYTMEQARKQTELALAELVGLAPSPYRDTLEALAREAVSRQF
ncbi:MAG: octaprenyl diphosphate synthase [Gammaproteobacteria bacterium HGW-Gammaproteobacteria-14]|nr:MAG: octaprenyl diphosphate synthase [Gammaproteobacteria bacterium HGW-Gammaproteobacteria-14]